MTARSQKGRFVVHTAAEVAAIREAARATAWVRDGLCRLAQPGVTTLDLDRAAGELIRQTGGKSAFLNYPGHGGPFPGQVCISVNDEVVHGFGRADRVLRAGDLVSLDVGVKLGIGIGDTAVTVCVGRAPDPLQERLLRATRESLEAGIAAARTGRDVCEIGRAVQKVVEAAGFGVVRDFVGHGCGTALHEPPEVPNFSTPARGPLLRPGMVLAIEPMVNAGTERVTVDADNWTVRTADGALSAHFEHLVLITEQEAEILTCPKTAASE